MYGTDFVNAKHVINTKFKNQKANPENLTLAERILLNRRKEQQQQRRDSPAGSVDISDLTNQNDERKTPTPEPTLENARKSPLKKQDSRRTLASEPQAGPSNSRHSQTPPLPPIKTASPKPESRAESVKSESRKSNVAESRKPTPVLPPIARKDSRASRASTKDDENFDNVQPPKDRREFDPNLGVGVDEETGSPLPQTPKPVKPEAEAPVNRVVEANKEEVEETNAKAQTPQPRKAETPLARKADTPKPMQKAPTPVQPRGKTPEQPVIVPVVAAAAASHRGRSKSRSHSRSRSRKRSRSRSRSRSQKRSRSPKRRSRSRRKSRNRSSSSSRSSSQRRHRRSKSRKRHRSLSYSSSSPRRRRRYSSSPEGRKGHSRGRSKARRSSFDYDFERARSIIRSLSRVGGEFPRQRPYEQPLPTMGYPVYTGNPAYPPYGNNPMYWPSAQRPESPRRRKQIIILQDGQVSNGKRRNNSSSGSDVSVIVQNGKNKGKKGKVRRMSVSDSDSEPSRSKSRSRKTKGKKVNFVTNSLTHDNTESGESDEERSVKKTSKTKNSSLKKAQRKQIEISDRDSSENEPETKENIPKMMVATPRNNKTSAVVEERKDVRAAARRPTPRNATPLQTKTPNSQNKTPTPRGTSTDNRQAKKAMSKEDLELQEAIEQLDKKADFELDQLKGSNSRKLPPTVNTKMQKKIFDKEFQDNLNSFLQS